MQGGALICESAGANITMETFAALGAGVGIGALGAGIGSAALSENAIKGVAVAAFGLNVVAVSIPGRLDDEVARAMSEKKDGGEKISIASNVLLPATGKSYITPAGWAFAIWGPIYLGEMAFTTMVALAKFHVAASESVKDILPFWVSANLFQGLWCATFRPRFHLESAKRTFGPFMSALYLGLTALSLGKVNMIVCSQSSAFTLLDKALFVPLTMHFGWTTAATLVNINGAVANYNRAGSDANLYGLGCMSVAAALGASLGVAVKTKAQTYSFVIGWALLAVSDGMKARIANSKKRTETSNASNIRKLSYFGGIASILTGLVTFVATSVSSTPEA